MAIKCSVKIVSFEFEFKKLSVTDGYG